jgi:iron(III) transport system substrate-binding protein
MRGIALLFLIVFLHSARSAVAEDGVLFPAGAGSQALVLRLLSSTDLGIIAPLIRGFQRERPDVAVRYREVDTRPLFAEMSGKCRARTGDADLVVSSAVDLQLKLVNDGCAQPMRSPRTEVLPAWARWRDEMFGLTNEPVVMVYNRAAFAGRKVPRSRFDLIDFLRAEPERVRKRIATYDIEISGVGYLFAFHDSRQATAFGRILESLGRAEPVLRAGTGEILDGIAEGRWIIGYNLLGSYAVTRAKQDPRIGVIYPQDYTLVLSRAAFIPKFGAQPALARAFIDFTLSPAGRKILSTQGMLFSGEHGQGASDALPPALRPIPFTPALLVGLDSQKRARFLSQWRNSLRPGVTIP